MSQSIPSESPFVVIPTYNEVGNIAKVISRLSKAVPQAKIVVVDDSSPDGTGELVSEIARDNDQVEVIIRAAKSGLGSAYRTGFALGIAAGASALIEMDADLSHEPEVVPELLKALDGGADFAIGSRYVPGGTSPGLTRARLALSRGGNIYAKIALGLKIKDATSGFRAYRPALLDVIGLDTVSADGYGFQIEMVFRATLVGAKIAEVPIIFRPRTEGTSKMSPDIVKEAMTLCTIWGAQHRIRQLAGNHSDFIPYHKSDGDALSAILSSYRS